MKTTLFFICAALLLQGCGSLASVYSNEELAWQDSRLVRGRVSTIKDISFDDSLVHVAVLSHLDGYEFISYWVIAPKSLNLEGGWNSGDIVDIYLGKGYEWFNTTYYKQREPLYQTASTDNQPQVLGIVCRKDDDGCEINTTPQTTIGFGRKMTDANDYRGVVAESKQRIYPVEIPATAGLPVGTKYTSSYAENDIAAAHEDPPEEQQQPHEDRCSGVIHRLTFGLKCKEL